MCPSFQIAVDDTPGSLFRNGGASGAPAKSGKLTTAAVPHVHATVSRERSQNCQPIRRLAPFRK